MCKVCNSPYKIEVDNQVLSGVSYSNVSKWLLTHKVRISHTTIKRHHDLGHCGAKRDSQIQVISVDTNPFQITIDENSENAQYQTRAILKRIYIQQLQIVDQKQRDYASGNSRYPAAEISGLKLIVECLARIGGNATAANADVLFERPKNTQQDRDQLLREIRQQVYGLD